MLISGTSNVDLFFNMVKCGIAQTGHSIRCPKDRLVAAVSSPPAMTLILLGRIKPTRPTIETVVLED